MVRFPDAPHRVGADQGERVMDIRWILVICAGGGALIGAAIGDLFGVSHLTGMILSGAGGAVGACGGLNLASKEADLETTQ
jgi:hypothetical protein